MTPQEILTGLRSLLRETSPPTAKPTGISLDGRKALILVRNGYEMKVADGPKRRVRTHEFTTIASLVDWLNRHVPEGDRDRTEILVNLTQGHRPTATITAALPDANYEGDVVMCRVAIHPAFIAWVDALAEHWTNKALLAFMRAHRADIVGDVGDLLVAELSKLSALRENEINAEQDTRGFVAFSSRTQRITVEGKLPPSFAVRVPIFLGQSATVLTVQLSLDLVTDDDDVDVVLHLACPALDVTIYEAQEVLVTNLQQALLDGFMVGCGTLAWKEDRKSVV